MVLYCGLCTLLRFPTDTSKKPFDSIQYTKTGNAPQLAQASAAPGTISPRRVAAKTVHVTKNVKDRPSSTMQTATQKPKKVMFTVANI